MPWSRDGGMSPEAEWGVAYGARKDLNFWENTVY